MTKLLLQKLNGNVPLIMLLIFLATSLVSFGAWKNQNDHVWKEIETIKKECVRKDVIQGELKSLNKNIEDMREDLKDVREYLMERP